MPCENQENNENHRIPMMIKKIMKIIDFHVKITKIIKINRNPYKIKKIMKILEFQERIMKVM